ncbi:four-carbon acid sugar kinase family protein [Kribbella sp. NPDC050820]|uniref:four-carbon acid sugar kinase family protein n=1 Tax=Kribbella sp. NPDC050820 TaxID=3155408 RepID=UPI0033D199BC
MLEAAFYGDDFTGSTDALRQYARCGLRSILLVDLPPMAELRTLAESYDVIGVAGIARSLPPDEQEAEIRPILTALRDLDPRVVQYKICSTADSSSTLGSIGRALEVGRSIFGSTPVPILAAQPELGRYTVFSHHFAAESGTIHRLDRQPTMSTHPATPMPESDLRRHVAAQTSLRIDAVHLTTYADLPDTYSDQSADAVVLDALTDADLHVLGRTLVASSNDSATFTIGSGGLSRALALNLTPSSPTHPTDPKPYDSTTTPAAPHGPLHSRTEDRDHSQPQVLAVSGSQSPRTADQIKQAAAAGWTILHLTDTEPTAAAAVQSLQSGAPGVVVHTGHATRPAAESLPHLASALAEIIHTVTRQTAVRRLVVAGGDTSSRVLRNLGITALELTTTAPTFGTGVAECRSIAPTPTTHALSILLKPGQLGPPNLLETFRTT